jgi:hypothetical protein
LFNIGQINSSPFVVSARRRSKNTEQGFQRVTEAIREFQSKQRELKHVQHIFDMSDLIRLNVGGQIIATRRKTLTKLPNSTLASFFNPFSPDRLFPNQDGSYFLDYNPVLFSHLLDQLRVLKNNESVVFRPPLSSLSSKPFNQMLRDLGLPLPQRSENDVIALNVGGEKIVTLRKTLTRVPDSKLAVLEPNSKEVKRDRLGRPFLDDNPIVFRRLLNQLREGKQVDGNTNIYLPTTKISASQS